MNRHDRNYEIILKDVKAKIKQVRCNVENEICSYHECVRRSVFNKLSQIPSADISLPVSLSRQESLQTLTLFAVAGELHSYSEVFEALSTLEVALGFLAMTGGESHMQLSSYLEEVLQMENQMAPHIFKVSLSERLSFRYFVCKGVTKCILEYTISGYF